MINNASTAIEWHKYSSIYCCDQYTVGWSVGEYTTWQTDELVGVRKEVSCFVL
jgi:hypothetical protein